MRRALGVTMSGDKNFLTRWSRRKTGARDGTSGKIAPAPSPSLPDPQPAVDLASLPPIDSIVAGSDVRAFLVPGVPAELTRAALRRAWSADPVIRDFVGLSENSWDFSAPGGVPGFGALTAGDAKRLLARFIGEGDAAPDIAPPDQPPAIASDRPIQEDMKQDQTDATEPLGSQPGDPASDIATQQKPEPVGDRPSQQWRRHGGALPE